VKKMTPPTVAVFLVLSAALLAVTLTQKKSEVSSPAPNAAQAETTSQWEYQTMVAKSPEELVVQANRGGTDSWEMVSAVHVLNTNRYQWVGFFKRLKR
jgi:hypothetical protein